MRRIIDLGFLSFVAAITVGFSSTNSASLVLIESARAIFIVAGVFCAFFVLRGLKIGAPVLFGALLVFLYYTWAAISGRSNEFAGIYVFDLAVSLAITILGMVYVSACGLCSSAFFVGRSFVVFAAAVFAVTALLGGVRVGLVPEFSYAMTSESGASVLYSQGVTKFYGLAAVASIWLAMKERSLAFRLILIATSLLFLYIAFIGGGRGDFFASIFIFTLVLLSEGGLKWATLGILPISALLVSDFGLDESVAAMRFVALFDAASGFGLRDELFAQSISLLMQQPRCLLVGCGFPYFQDFYGLEYGMYPHNFVLEALISWGLFAAVLAAIFFAGLFFSHESRLYFWVGAFFLLISLKSGDIFSSWIVTIFIFYCAGRGLYFFIFSGYSKFYERSQCGD